MKAYRHMMARGGTRLLAHRLNKLKSVLVPILVVGALAAAAPRAEATPLAPSGIVPALGIPFPGGTELDSVFYAGVGLANLVVEHKAARFYPTYLPIVGADDAKLHNEFTFLLEKRLMARRI